MLKKTQEICCEYFKSLHVCFTFQMAPLKTSLWLRPHGAPRRDRLAVRPSQPVTHDFRISHVPSSRFPWCILGPWGRGLRSGRTAAIRSREPGVEGQAPSVERRSFWDTMTTSLERSDSEGPWGRTGRLTSSRLWEASTSFKQRSSEFG